MSGCFGVTKNKGEITHCANSSERWLQCSDTAEVSEFDLRSHLPPRKFPLQITVHPCSSYNPLYATSAL